MDWIDILLFFTSTNILYSVFDLNTCNKFNFIISFQNIFVGANFIHYYQSLKGLISHEKGSKNFKCNYFFYFFFKNYCNYCPFNEKFSQHFSCVKKVFSKQRWYLPLSCIYCWVVFLFRWTITVQNINILWTIILFKYK